MKNRIMVIKQTKTGRNVLFYDRVRQTKMTREVFVNLIAQGGYPGYHVRMIDGIPTPVSNPDFTVYNNLF